MSRKLVVIADPVGVIDTRNERVLERHRNYQVLLRRASEEEYDLRILSRVDLRKTNARPDELFVFFSSMAAWLVGSTIWMFKNRRRIKTLVAGDPWFGAWFILLMRSIICRSARVQIQLHGDFTNRIWRSLSWKNAMRFPTLKITLRSANILRLVGNFQEASLRSFLGGTTPNLVVAPLEFPTGTWKSRELNLDSKFRIGVVGRLHEDRGVFELIKAFECLSKERLKFEVLFAGDGPDLVRVKTLCQSLNLPAQFLGSLNQQQLEKMWDSIDVLFSFAPLESYGLAIREALCRGLRVLTIENGGTQELIDEIGPESGVVLLPKEWRCEVLADSLTQLSKCQPEPRIREFFSNAMLRSRQNLIDSWLV